MKFVAPSDIKPTSFVLMRMVEFVASGRKNTVPIQVESFWMQNKSDPKPKFCDDAVFEEIGPVCYDALNRRRVVRTKDGIFPISKWDYWLN